MRMKRMMNTKRATLFVTLGLLAALPVALSAQGRPNPLEVLKGKPMPAFSMRTLEGRTLNNQNLRGRVVVIDFFATWCGPCKIASQAMQRIHNAYAGQNVTVIGASGWEDGDAAKLVADYRRAHNRTYTLTINNDALMRRLRIPGVPAFVILDKRGVVREALVGWDPAHEARFQTLIDELLKE